ncbi:MAG: hypothetical protein FJZ58_04345 [Chlamydiae bacterium]|nr:hypothetical protein [Chlamydiota bacterium]
MGKKSLTRDELFLLKTAEIARGYGGIFHPVSCYQVGKAIGQNDRSVDNIVRMLAQTNFVQKGHGNLISLTKQGETLVHTLMGQGSSS